MTTEHDHLRGERAVDQDDVRNLRECVLSLAEEVIEMATYLEGACAHYEAAYQEAADEHAANQGRMRGIQSATRSVIERLS